VSTIPKVPKHLFEKTSFSLPEIRRSIYTLSIDSFFNARHFVLTQGHPGQIHTHTFRVSVVVCQKVETSESYVFGFSEFRQIVQAEIDRFNGTLLNNVPPFSEQREPTTENLAAVIYQGIAKRLPTRLQLESVTISESPTAHVTYREEVV
jgi:6-pyruvoyltetrahydropterin/6-carboxytetrahydropterin synthase